MGESAVGYGVPRSFQIWLCIIFLAILTGLHPTSAADAGLRSVKCPAGTAAYVNCGRFNVPLNYRQPHGEQLSLWFAMINGTLEGPKSQAIIIIPGGPGISSSLAILPSFFNRSLAPSQPTVLLDLRGTGLSQPLLCSLQNDPAREVFIAGGDPDLIAKCAFELGPRRVFFNSADSARDIEVLRQLLSVSQWNLVGLSYGAQVSTFYASLFPRSSRTITLDSPFPLGRYERGRELYNALLRSIRAACERTSACSGEQVLKDLAAVLADIRQNPRDTLSPEKLAIILFSFAATSNVAVALSDAREGNYTALERLYSSLNGMSGSDPPNVKMFSVALSFATPCLEFDFIWQPDDCKCEQLAKYERFILSSRPDAFTPFSPQEWIKASSAETRCVGWPPLPKGVRFQDLIPRPRGIIDTKGTPVLVVSGEIDLVTALIDGRRTARQFSRRRFAVIANAGHIIIERSRCGTELMSEFVVTGRFPENTSRCADPASQPFIP